MVRNEQLSGEVSASDKLLHLISTNSTENKLFGRTKLTKLGFFAEYWDPNQDILDSNQRIGDFRYIIFKHGPFSKELFDQFDKLKASGLLEESRQPIGGSEISVTEEGQERSISILKRLSDDDIKQIQAVGEKFSSYTGGELEDLSLRYLGITESEKIQHQNENVEEIIRMSE